MTKAVQKVTYGYARDASGKLVEVPEQQEVILDIVTWREVDGMSDRTIAEELNERGILSQRGKPWNHSSVTNVRKANEDRLAPKIQEALEEREKTQRERYEKAAAENHRWMQLEEERARKEGFLYETEFYDLDKGAYETKVELVSGSQWGDACQLAAFMELMKREGTSVFRFHRFGTPELSPVTRKKHVDTIIERLARDKGTNLRKAVRELEGPKWAKQDVAKHINAVLHELAVAYQENAHLRQKLQDLGDVRERELTPDQEAALAELRGELQVAGSSREEQDAAIQRWATEHPRTRIEELRVRGMLAEAQSVSHEAEWERSSESGES